MKVKGGYSFMPFYVNKTTIVKCKLMPDGSMEPESSVEFECNYKGDASLMSTKASNIYTPLMNEIMAIQSGISLPIIEAINSTDEVG